MTDEVTLPDGLLAFAGRSPEWEAWLTGLPRLVRDTLEAWELSRDGDVWHGMTALVVPVVEATGRPAAVKFGWAHEEQEHEHLGLQTWHGNGMVQLFRAEPAQGVMLLERLHADRDLTSIDAIEACEITANLYRRLHVPAPPQLRMLSSYIERWTSDLSGLDRDAPLPRRLVEQAISLGRTFVSDPATDGTMIHGDLHYENVLAADREPWLAIDPKPMSGDPHYEVAPLLWNRWDDIASSGDVRAAIRQRFHTVVDTAELDEGRTRDWVVVRELHNAMWVIEDSPDGLDAEAREELTQCITIAKAVQD